jgi:hypothetical protein
MVRTKRISYGVINGPGVSHMNENAVKTAITKQVSHILPIPRAFKKTSSASSWQSSAMSFCIAGRGPLYEAAASTLTHLLGKQGFAARLIGCENVWRDRTASLDVSEATMACILYLNVRGSSARQRYHIQPLKHRLGREHQSSSACGPLRTPS